MAGPVVALWAVWRALGLVGEGDEAVRAGSLVATKVDLGVVAKVVAREGGGMVAVVMRGVVVEREAM